MNANADLSLIIGLLLVVFSVPSIVSSFSDRRAPRVATIVLMAGGGLIIWALKSKPGGYTLNDLPDVFIGVVNRLL